MTPLRRWLFLGARRLADTGWGRALISLGFTYMSFAIPVERLHETKTLLAFHHPRPSYETHILLVPKRSIPNMLSLSPADNDFLQDVFSIVGTLVNELELTDTGYSLTCNGGAYQDIPHLHFHLISGSAISPA